jgi:hypothetical protein
MSGMFNRLARPAFAWRHHLLRDVTSAPAGGVKTTLSSHVPCEGWTKHTSISSSASFIENRARRLLEEKGHSLSLNAHPA